MFSAKVHRVGGEVLVACCDLNILGARLTDGRMDHQVGDGFYGGEEIDAAGFVKLMAEATSANLLGDKVVGLALKEGLIDETGVMELCGVKHAQLYTV